MRLSRKRIRFFDLIVIQVGEATSFLKKLADFFLFELVSAIYPGRCDSS